MKRNGYFTLESVIDTWGRCSDENINIGAILSFDGFTVLGKLLYKSN